MPTTSPARLDGRPATAADLTPLAFAGFAHFTAMQVRDGRVRGLDLHLARLRSASLEFFDRAVSDARVRAELRAATEARLGACSLTATMFTRSGEFTPGAGDEEPSMLVRTDPPSEGPRGPLRLAAFAHERPLPTIKHVGESAKTHYLRRAVRQGFDDAVFLDAGGRLSEATIWNLVLWDGASVVWPDAAMLPGVTMGIVRRRLASLGVPQRRQAVTLDSLRTFVGAAVMNSWTPGIAVAGIASVALPGSDALVDLLHRVYETEPPVAL